VFRTDRDEARERGTKYTEARGRVEQYTRKNSPNSRACTRKRNSREPPRYWEDVKEGEELPRMMKGPMTVTGFICYAQGWAALYIRANKLAIRCSRRIPAWASAIASTCPIAPSACIGTKPSRSKSVHPVRRHGPERCSWLNPSRHQLDRRRRLPAQEQVQIRRHNPDGDAMYIDGTVTRKFVENGKHYVEITQKATTHRGEVSAFAAPSPSFRAAPAWPRKPQVE